MDSWNIYEFINLSNSEREDIITLYRRNSHCLTASFDCCFIPFYSENPMITGILASSTPNGKVISKLRSIRYLGGSICYFYRDFGLSFSLLVSEVKLFYDSKSSSNILNQAEVEDNSPLNFDKNSMKQFSAISTLMSITPVWKQSAENYDIYIGFLGIRNIQIQIPFAEDILCRHLIMFAEYSRFAKPLETSIMNHQVRLSFSARISYPIFNYTSEEINKIIDFGQLFINFKINVSIN